MHVAERSLLTSQRRFLLLPSERLLLAMVLGLGSVALLLGLLLQRNINWPPFIIGYLASLGFVPLGAYVRGAKDSPRLSLGLVGTGCFCAATAAFSVLSFAMLPVPNPMVDDWLTQTGHWVGYDWRDFVIMMTAYPTLTTALSYVYQVAPTLLLVTICVLAAHNKATTLHQFLFVGVFSLLVALAIWWLWPSVGYVGKLPLSDAALAENRLVYGTDYGAVLTHLIQFGPKRITPEVITGVIGFPSYHMVMACLVGWYSRHTVLAIPMALVTLAMIPATLVHGGHHLIDLLGGLAVFALSVWLAGRMIRPDDTARS
jgi:PAP2 superfamily